MLFARIRKLIYVLLVFVVLLSLILIILPKCRVPKTYRIEIAPRTISTGETYIYHASFHHDGEKDLNLYQTEYEMRETTDCSIYGDIIIKTSVTFSKQTYKRGEEVSVEVRIKAVCDRTTAVTNRRNDGYPTFGGGGTYIADGIYLNIFFDCNVMDPKNRTFDCGKEIGS